MSNGTQNIGIGIGIVEGFFGPEWSWASRRDICQSLSSRGGAFYIYSPKRDSFLRKKWMQSHPPEMWAELNKLSSMCETLNVKFGVGLSPFEIHEHWDASSKQSLKDKLKRLEELNLTYIGLFFDDMKGAPDLAEKQAEIMDFVRVVTNLTVLFCPTYYSADPILDRVFGARPERYLEKLGESLAPEIHVLWTGSRVISKSISAEDLEQVAAVIKRKPLLWDNYYANDGPKQCKFLSLKPLEGSSHEAFAAAAGWAFNLMNQANLSDLVFRSSYEVLIRRADPHVAFERTLQSMANPELAKFIQENPTVFREIGLDNLEPKVRTELIASFREGNPCSLDVSEWLAGQYVVGAECLTD